ncbi:MAG: substrate-binding domain-containing protein [Chloroflexi bacterium]|nr:substrate-binding domain-containing protein [Chloroflexota bacterium]
MSNSYGSSFHNQHIGRRGALLLVMALGVGALLLACSGGKGSGSSSAVPTGTLAPGLEVAKTEPNTSVVRLASVKTIKDGGLLDELLSEFQKQSGYTVEVYIGEDIYEQARAGKADIVFSHLGHHDAQAFLTEGLGEWPHTVLFNETALIVPTGDPAHILDVTDPVEAFRRIAQTQSPFIVNDIEGQRYVAETLWIAAGKPERGGWYIDTGVRGNEAMRLAAERGGYSLWGVTPFLVAQKQQRLGLRPLVLNDALVQRIMVTVVVNPDKIPGTNVAGARALQEYLVTPATQARIRAFRYPGIDQPIFWPAGRNNSGANLPGGE